MNAAELLVRCLEVEGVRYIFGVPGEENADLLMALEGSSIDFVLTRHEQGAAFMADVYGRLTGTAGVCLGTLGPGATNLVTGVADANMDRAPLVVITGQADSRRLHKESHQSMDVVGLFHPITKWARSIISPKIVPEVVRKAFKLATTEKPGACHIELPEDIAGAAASGTPLEPRRVRRPVPDDKVVGQALAMLREAERPLLIAGNGAIRRRAAKQLRRFVKATGLGVTSTFMGKGCVPREWATCLYTIGLQSRDLVTCAVEAADVIVTLGYDLVEYHPRLWNPAGDKRIIHIDFLPAEVDECYHPEIEVVGDLAHTLWMMNEQIAEQPLDLSVAQHHEIHRQMRDELAVHAADETAGRIRPQKAIWDAREVLGPDDILLSDVGAHKMWVARHYQCDEPNTCLISNGFCSMGFALPGAIAAKLACPDRKVLAICGDGGFLMNVQEMETARRLGSDIVVMVWEDGGYGLIEWKQQSRFGRHTNLGFTNPDFIQLAESFGWWAMRAENAVSLKPALEEAFAIDRPALVTIPIDYRENALLSKRLGEICCPI